MHELCSSLGGGLGDDGGPCGLHRLPILPAALVKNADEIDDGLRPFRGAPDRIRIAKVCLHGVDLTDAALRLQVKCKIGPAHGHANSPSALGERPYHMAADEAGTSVNRDELVVRRFGHDKFGVLRGVARASDTRWPRLRPARPDQLTSGKAAPYLAHGPRWRNW